MTAYTAWLDETMPDLPGALQAMVINAIRNSAIEFCEKTDIYIYQHPAIDAVLNTPTYAFVPPASTLVAKVLQVFYNGLELIPKTPDELKSIYGIWNSTDWRDRTGAPRYYTQDDERNIRLVPMPDASLTGAIKLRVSLKPTRASTTIEDRIYEEYLEAIKYGALYRMKSLLNKPYSDPNGAVASFNLFNQSVDAAKDKASKGL